MTELGVFLDTSALFAGIWSSTGGGRMLLKLGEAGVLNLCLSSSVLSELDRVLRRKAPEQLGVLTLLLDRIHVTIVPEPSEQRLQEVRRYVLHPGDARVIAAAWQARVEYFVMLDRQHLLSNEPLIQVLPFPMGTPGDCLAWCRQRLSG